MKRTKEQTDNAINTYPGAAENSVNDNKVTPELEKERTCTLNNNPRNNEKRS